MANLTPPSRPVLDDPKLQVVFDRVQKVLVDLFKTLQPLALWLASSPWITLALGTGWSLYSATTKVQFCIDPLHSVRLRGIVSSASVATTTLSTLPSYARPARAMIFPIYSQGGMVRLTVGTDGTLVLNVVLASAQTQVSLDGVSFDLR